jgi:cytochrome c5
LKRYPRLIFVLASAAVILIAACGGAAPAPTATTAAPQATTAPVATTAPSPDNGGGDGDGEALFLGKGICYTCHIIEGVSEGLIGPDLTHIGTDAATRRPGVSAQDYITESIREPEAFVAEGIERATPGLMTTAITANLSDSEVNALVEFLLTQE